MSRKSNSDNYNQTGATSSAAARARREIGKWSIEQIVEAVRYVVHAETVWTGDLEMSVLKHLQDSAQSVGEHPPAGPYGYQHVLNAKMWHNSPPAPVPAAPVPVAPTPVPAAPAALAQNIKELPRTDTGAIARSDAQQRRLEEYDPCSEGPDEGIYRCALCDTKDDLITYETIGAGHGICVDKKCYNNDILEDWIRRQTDRYTAGYRRADGKISIIPHNNRELRLAELQDQLRHLPNPPEPYGCTAPHLRDTYLSPAFHDLTGEGVMRHLPRTIMGGRKHKKYKKRKTRKRKKKRKNRRKKTKHSTKRQRCKTKRRRRK